MSKFRGAVQGIDHRYLRELERGAVGTIDATTIHEISHAFGIAPSDILRSVLPNATEIADDAKLFRAVLLASASAPSSMPKSEDYFRPKSETINGVGECMSTAIELVNSVPPLRKAHSRQVIVTWREQPSLIDAIGDPEIRTQWVCAIRSALDKGWDVHHIVEIDGNKRKAALIMLNLLALLGSRGLYTPRLLPKNPEESQQRDDYVLVPDFGGLQWVGVERCKYYPPGQRLATLCQKVQDLWERSAHVYSTFPPVDFDDAIARVDDYDSDTWLVMDGLSESLIPLDIYEKRAESVMHRRGAIGLRARKLAEIRRLRDDAMVRQAATWRRRNVSLRSAIDRFVSEGIYSDDDTLLSQGAGPLTKGQRIMVLSELVDRLRTYPGYELILLPEGDEVLCRTYYLAKSDYAVLLESWTPVTATTRKLMHIEIREPSIVNAFCQNPLWWRYFRPSYRQACKQQTISYLLEEIRRLAVDIVQN